jgi:GNAT superfamily N-acetyltransferase
VCFVAEWEGYPIAAAAIAIHDGVALLAGASTDPVFRGRGAQAALLETRLGYAASVACELAMMGALPGSASQRNGERQGFRIAYTRIKWQLPRKGQGSAEGLASRKQRRHPERRGAAGIQNGGVIRMSGMSSILSTALYRDVPSHHEPK